VDVAARSPARLAIAAMVADRILPPPSGSPKRRRKGVKVLA
jgi:hypothetical protein